MPKFGISPLRKFENAYLLAEDFSLFPCLQVVDMAVDLEEDMAVVQEEDMVVVDLDTGDDPYQ